MVNGDKVSLLLFTCSGREHLLPKAYSSFVDKCDYGFDKIVIGIDGSINTIALNTIPYDLIVQSSTRRGYVQNITNSLNVIDTDYFFWLEDDWLFNEKVEIDSYIDKLKNNHNWVQIRMSKNGPINVSKAVHLFDSYFISENFSANPSLNRTAFVKRGFDFLYSIPAGEVEGVDGFEDVLSKYFHQNKYVCVIDNPIHPQPIFHDGYMESTDRKWHMTASISNKGDLVSSSRNSIKATTYFNKIGLAVKLIILLVTIIVKTLLGSERAYDFGFRIVHAPKAIK